MSEPKFKVGEKVRIYGVQNMSLSGTITHINPPPGSEYRYTIDIGRNCMTEIAESNLLLERDSVAERLQSRLEQLQRDFRNFMEDYPS